MRMRLTRRSDALLPLALLLPTLLGRADAAFALAAANLLMRLATLCAADGFRRAASVELSERKNRGSAATALLLTLFLSAAAWRWGAAASALLPLGHIDPARWDMLCATGALLALARLHGEILRARVQEGSAELCDVLTAALLAAAVLMGDEFVWMCAAALSALISLVIALAVGGWPYGLPRAALLARLPGALLRALLYPLPGLYLCAICARAGARFAEVGFLLGLAAFGAAASPFRRTDAESPGLNLWLLAPASAFAAAAAWLPMLRAPATLYAMAAVCAMLVNAALAPRALAALFLTGAAAALLHADGHWTCWAATACGALAWALLVPYVRLAHLRHRARRTREKNIRSIMG